jgi:hypothetical protein
MGDLAIACADLLCTIPVLWGGQLSVGSAKTWIEVSIAMHAMLVFTTGVLLASLIHRNLFSMAELATWLWFGGFLISTFLLGLLSAHSLRLATVGRHE